MDFFLYRSEIFPRFQKSYLENRAMSLKMRKIEQTKFALQISPDFGHIWLHVMYNCPRAPSRVLVIFRATLLTSTELI